MYEAVKTYIESLEISQGQLAGKPFRLLPWQKRYLRDALKPGVQEAALSMGRGAGKSTLIAGVGCAFLEADGVRQAGSEITVVASTIPQAEIIFDHVLRFLGSRTGSFKKRHSTNGMQLKDKQGTTLKIAGSNPNALHGAAPSLVIADEIAQWPGNRAPRMLSALRTGLGKIPNSRMFTLGTRADSADSPWERSIQLADIAHVYAARDTDPVFQKRTWEKANPTLRAAGFDALIEAYYADARKARRDPDLLQSFKALRLNQGVSEVIENYVLSVDAYERCIAPSVEIAAPYVLGVDLGSTAAMSAVAAYSVQTNGLDVIAALPHEPDLIRREVQDGVAGLYRRMLQRDELILSGEHVVNVGELLDLALSRWGKPVVIVCDRWRLGDLQEALSGINFPFTRLETRGQGFKDGAEDVRAFRQAALSGQVQVQESLLLASAVREARLISDPAGNQKLSKSTQGGRRSRGRDDALAAAILAVAQGSRIGIQDGSGVYLGAV